MFGSSMSASACRSASNRATTCLVSIPSLMTFAMAAVLFTARAETRQAATIAATEQHFTIISSSQGQFPETFVLDTRNGRVWMMHGQVTKQPFLIPCSYNLPDGNANLVPLEADTEIG